MFSKDVSKDLLKYTTWKSIPRFTAMETKWI